MNYKWSLGIGALILVFDQMSKWLVIKYLSPYKDVIKLTPFLNLIHIRNTGIAFGIFAGNQSLLKEPLILLLTASAILGLFLYLYYSKNINFIKLIACGLILGGALGNFIDRLLRGEVIDFIDLHIAHHHWPAFNVADSTVSLGVFLLLLNLTFKRTKS